MRPALAISSVQSSVRLLIAVSLTALVLGIALPFRGGDPLPGLVPVPRSIESADRALFARGPIRLGARSRVIVRDPSLRAVAESLEEALWSLADVDVGLATTTTRLEARDGDIVLALETALAREEYRLHVGDAVEIRGGSAAAVSWAVASLLQMSTYAPGTVSVPRVRVHDVPAHPVRGLVLDVASRPHTMEQLRELVEFARFYKVNYLQLRLTGDDAVALPTSIVDTGRPWRVYARTDLQALEDFASARGVTIVPEIGLPGTARALVSSDPTLFSLADRAANPRTVHVAREAVYEAIDSIIGDVAQIFPRAPFIHVGGLDVNLEGFDRDPEAVAFMESKGIGNLAELQRHFTARVAHMVSKRGRRPLIWDLPPPGMVPLPADLGVLARGLGSEELEGALHERRLVVNVSPTPLDVAPGRRGTLPDLEAWSPLEWRHWDPEFPSWEGVELSSDAAVSGGAVAVWSLEGFLALPALRRRIPRVAEALWSGTVEDDVSRRVDGTDAVVMSRLRPARIIARGRTDPDYDGPDLNRGDRFAEGLHLETEPRIPGDRVLVAVDGSDPDGAGRGATPQRLVASAPVRIQVADQAGRTRGFSWLRFLERRPLELRVRGVLPREPGTSSAALRFVDSATVSVQSLGGEGEIRYTTDGWAPGPESTLYDGPVVVAETSPFRAALFTPSGSSLGEEEQVSLVRIRRVAHLARGRPARSGPRAVPSANHVFDGLVDPTRAWTPPAWAEEPWVEVDLGREVAVAGVTVYAASGGGLPRYRVRGAGSDGRWAALVDRTDGSGEEGSSGTLEDTFDPVPIRFLRIEPARSEQGAWPGLLEVAVRPPSILTADRSGG